MRLIVGGVLLLMAALAALSFHARYWRWRDCFNELGRCYDPASAEVYLEQAGILWGGLAVLCLLGAAITLKGASRRR